MTVFRIRIRFFTIRTQFKILILTRIQSLLHLNFFCFIKTARKHLSKFWAGNNQKRPFEIFIFQFTDVLLFLLVWIRIRIQTKRPLND